MQVHIDAPEFQPAIAFMQWWFAANALLRSLAMPELDFASARYQYEDYLRAHAAEDARQMRVKLDAIVF